MEFILPRSHSMASTSFQDPQRPLKIGGTADCVAFSPDDKHIAAGSTDKMIVVWDAMTGKKVLGPLRRHPARVTSISFSPDCTKLVSSSSGGTVQIWDAQTGVIIVGPLELR